MSVDVLVFQTPLSDSSLGRKGLGAPAPSDLKPCRRPFENPHRLENMSIDYMYSQYNYHILRVSEVKSDCVSTTRINAESP